MLIGIRDNLYIIPIEDPDRLASGLYIPEKAKQRPDHGIVKYRGPEVKDIRVGDHVLFYGYSGTQITTEDDGILYVMAEDDIFGLWIPAEGEVREWLLTRTKVHQLIDLAIAFEKQQLGQFADPEQKTLLNDIAERIKHYTDAHFAEELQF